MVSIHALLAECDCLTPCTLSTYKSFNPRTPCGVRLNGFYQAYALIAVSIHALLAECDVQLWSEVDNGAGFNPRTPCGVRPSVPIKDAVQLEFQSTHSLRSATNYADYNWTYDAVSIHALLAECDTQVLSVLQICVGFNPRTPCGVRHEITAETFRIGSFNPRTPCGVRLKNALQREHICWFQSTHSLRSATPGSIHQAGDGEVSIHALLAECDCMPWFRQLPTGCFNPRTPCGVRLPYFVHYPYSQEFQSTHSLRSATAPDLIHCYSTEQIILCANLPKKTVIARLLFLSIYLSIFYSQCITPIADLPGNSCELEVGAQAMFNSL